VFSPYALRGSLSIGLLGAARRLEARPAGSLIDPAPDVALQTGLPTSAWSEIRICPRRCRGVDPVSSFAAT
jgi:hypothetical protein